ncbi:MAG TPA: beta-L-arabinofuranosidase domain-containing protein, partial [Chitinophagaceae bacterium]
MKKSLLLVLPVILLLFVAFKGGADIDLKSFKLLSLSEVKPEGWLKSGILRDMKSGYPSALVEMQPTLRNRVFTKDKVTNFSIDKNGDYTIRKATWWWGEHEGYHADLVVRSAYLTGDPQLIAKADSIVHSVLSNQEEDGYIGIYQKGHRLGLLKGENGELWTQSLILGALLAYYEFTGKKEVLQAVERAAKLTMSQYGPSKKSYFHIPGNDGG